MAKKERSEDMATEVEVQEVPVEVAPVEVAPVTKVLIVAPQNKAYTFEQWAKFRKKADRHMGGMKAFLGASVGNKYPLEKWDEMMQAY